MHQLQRSWVRSQHPSAQWNLRGGRWSSAEYCTEQKRKNPPKEKKESQFSRIARQKSYCIQWLAQTDVNKTHILEVSAHSIIQSARSIFYPLLSYTAEISAIWPQACRVCGRKSRSGFGRRGRRQPVSREPSPTGPRQGLRGLPEAEFLDEIQTKVLWVFLLSIYSFLYSFALRFLFLQIHETSYSFYSSTTVHCKGEKRKIW